MPQPDALDAPAARRRRVRRERDNPLVRAVGRVPVKVRTKLLVAFAVIAALLVAVGVLGLRVLGQSNARVESLGTLQLRAATYQSLQTQAQQLRQLLAIRAGGRPEPRHLRRRQRVRRPRRAELDARRPSDRRRALAARTRDERDRGSGSCRRRADEALLRRIRLRLPAASRARSTRIIALDRAGAPSKKSQPLPVGCDQRRQRPRRPDRPARDDDARQDGRADRPERQLVRVLAQPVHRRRRGSILLALLLGLRPLVVADRPDPANRGAPRGDRRRATSRGMSRCPTATSSARWP